MVIMILNVAKRSLLYRKGTMALIIFSIALSTAILLTVEYLRIEAKQSFGKMVSGTDLIVGARTGQLNLLLYSVFQIGNPTNNISYSSYQLVAKNPQVAWTIPISLGDSHRGYRVIGTSHDYFEHFKFGKNQSLSFSQGNAFSDVFDTVVGFEVAKKLQYEIGDPITLSHGLGSTSFINHDETPFKIVGVLAATGTPVDKAIFVSLQGIEAIHHDDEHLHEHSDEIFEPESITAFLIGVRSKISTFSLQRAINEYSKEPLTAILPGVALVELWQMLTMFERLLLLISVLVLVAALAGMAAVLLTALRERRQEFILLRTLGAPTGFIALFIQCEVLLITLTGLLLGGLVCWLSILLGEIYLAENFGIFISQNIFHSSTLIIVGAILAGSFLIGFIPVVSAYRKVVDSHEIIL